MLTRILALAGTALAWFPILVTVLFAVIGSIAARKFRLDYLMPAELFPVAFAGGALLLGAALRMRRERRLIAGALAAMFVLLAGGQLLAVVTGLAAGEREPAGLLFGLVLAMIVGYALADIVLATGGLLLVRWLFRGYHR